MLNKCIIMVERKVRWNRFTDTGEQIRLRHKYIVAILNEPREIRRIRQKFIEQMAPVDEFYDLGDFPIQSSGGLHCLVFSFLSDCGKIQYPEKIYGNQNQFRRDRDLYERNKYDLINYIDRLSVS